MHSPSLIPDASELLSSFMANETDVTCKRNAFAALASIDHDAALTYLSSVFDGIPNAEELLQLVELEFIRKDAMQNPQNKVSSLELNRWYDQVLTVPLGPLPALNLRFARGWRLHGRIRSCLVFDGTDQ